MKKLATTLVMAGAMLLSACGGSNNGGDINIKIGVVGSFNDHWTLVQEMVEGINIELVVFSDFLTPNLALDSGDLDMNSFQNKLFLDNEIATNGYDIEYIGETWIVPLNLFNNTSRISSMADFTDGHTIAIPSDPTNSSRSLRFLDYAGLISLSTADGELASVLDIIPGAGLDINIMEVESGMLASILPDVEAAVINGGNAFTAGLIPSEDSIFLENIESTSADALINIVVVRSEDVEADGERMRAFEQIMSALNSEEMREFVLTEYGGAFIPVW